MTLYISTATLWLLCRRRTGIRSALHSKEIVHCNERARLILDDWLFAWVAIFAGATKLADYLIAFLSVLGWHLQSLSEGKSRQFP